MGSFLKYLDKMDKNFNHQEEKENYIDDIDESSVVYEEEEIEEPENVISESPLPKSNNVYKRRLVNELNEIGLNKKKINEIVNNIFTEGVYEDDDDDEYVNEEYTVRPPSQRPARPQPSSFKQKMQQKKNTYVRQQKPIETMSSRAADILEGIPGGDDSYIPTVIPNIPQQQQYMQQQYMPPQQQYTPPPQPMYNGPMDMVNNGAGGEVGPVMASAPQPMLKMPEGFEKYIPQDSGLPPIQQAMGILSEPRGEHVGQASQIMMPAPAPMSQPVHPQMAQNILAQPGNEHIVGNPNGGAAMSNISNHASQLL